MMYDTKSEQLSGETMFNAYKYAVFAGANPNFITEKQLAEGKLPSGILVIPNAVHVTDAALSAIRRFSENGGKIVTLGTSNLTRNEQNRTTDLSGISLMKSFATDGSEITDSEGYQSFLEKYITTPAAVEDENGNSLKETDIICTEYDGDVLINLCNYSWNEQKSFKIPDGFACINMLTMESCNNTVVLEPFVPVILLLEEVKEEKIKVTDFSNRNGLIIVTLQNISADRATGTLIVRCIDDSGVEKKAFSAVIQADTAGEKKIIYDIGDIAGISEIEMTFSSNDIVTTERISVQQ